MYRIRPVSIARSLPRSHVGISGRAFVNVAQQRFQSSNPRVSESVKRDHRELEKCWELARHSIAEEIVVYPAFERHLPNGEEMAEKDRSQHQEVCRSNAAWADCG